MMNPHAMNTLLQSEDWNPKQFVLLYLGKSTEKIPFKKRDSILSFHFLK